MKQVKNSYDIYSEKEFNKLISKQNLNTLKFFKDYSNKPNEIVLEYVKDSTTLADKFTESNCKTWGKITEKMHSIKFDECFKIDNNNEKKTIIWSNYMEYRINDAFEKASKHNNYGFKPKKLEQIRKYLKPLTQINLQNFSLIHGDYHAGNILIINDDLIIFDKNSETFTGDKLLDLAIATVDIPNGTLMSTDNKKYTNDRNCLKSFISGYGENYLKKKNFKEYIMLIAFGRLYTLFSENYGEIINKLLIK